MHTASRSGLSVAAAIALLAIVLSGCAGAEAAPKASPTPTVALTLETDAAPVSGTGPTEPFPGIDFPLPSGARSVAIDVECTGGTQFFIELGDSMAAGQAALRGTCDGTTTVVWPVSEKTSPTLYVWTAEGVAWVATPRFSSEEFVPDEAITAECDAFSKVYSALTNADIGYTTYQAFDEAERMARIDTASADLESLVVSSETAMADSFAQVLATVRAEGSTPGFLSAGQSLTDSINSTCNTNHSPMILMAEFGG